MSKWVRPRGERRGRKEVPFQSSDLSPDGGRRALVIGDEPLLLGAAVRLGGGDGSGDAVVRPAVLCRVGLDLVVGVHREHPLDL